jgi:thiol-disulfide isomerase/thioredoxin
MTATFLRFVVALLSWMSLPFVAVGALAPEESTEFDGQKVTDFGLQARDGRKLDVRDFRGTPVIVEFFASGSSACRAQLKQLIELHDRYLDQGLAIFALAVDQFETQEAVKDVESLIFTMEAAVSGWCGHTRIGKRLSLQRGSSDNRVRRRRQNCTHIFWLPRNGKDRAYHQNPACYQEVKEVI